MSLKRDANASNSKDHLQEEVNLVKTETSVNLPECLDKKVKEEVKSYLKKEIIIQRKQLDLLLLYKEQGEFISNWQNERCVKEYGYEKFYLDVLGLQPKVAQNRKKLFEFWDEVVEPLYLDAKEKGLKFGFTDALIAISEHKKALKPAEQSTETVNTTTSEVTSEPTENSEANFNSLLDDEKVSDVDTDVKNVSSDINLTTPTIESIVERTTALETELTILRSELQSKTEEIERLRKKNEELHQQLARYQQM